MDEEDRKSRKRYFVTNWMDISYQFDSALIEANLKLQALD